MARRRKSRRRAPQRSELTLTFAITEAGTHYISIPCAMSMINRQLFRGARTYAVESVKLFTATSGSSPDARISTIPDNWVTRNAIKKAFHLWKDMNDKVLDQNPSLKGTWSDFKPAMTSAHTTSWLADNIGTLRPIDGGRQLTKTPQEWAQAQIVYPQHTVDIGSGEPLAAINNFLHVMGDDNNGGAANGSVGIIKGYEDTRATVQAEDPSDDPVNANSWMITLFDEGSSDPELMQMVLEENDQPPYDLDDYPGAGANFVNPQFQGYLACSYDLATGATKTQDMIGGFLAPLGLLQVDATTVAGTNYLQVKLMPGTYKGCLSESLI